MERTKSGLYVARSFNVLRMRPKQRTVTLRNGQRAKVTKDDSGTVTQIETDEQLHGIATPKTIRLKLGRIGD
jgi:hypothetical protein